ncbi:MAG: hydroxymyristoyl-ACP dehydratase [Burkholderiales bacterium]|nr:hydroxymyristoyl-ACP dehydratase [Bacteroidia bacterium]
MHNIFKGHFEQMPIVPGVCQTQIIKELLQIETGQSLVLTKGDNIKFTGMIIPTEHTEVYVEISFKKEDNNYIVDAKLFFENITFTKFKGSFKQN